MFFVDFKNAFVDFDLVFEVVYPHHVVFKVLFVFVVDVLYNNIFTRPLVSDVIQVYAIDDTDVL